MDVASWGGQRLKPDLFFALYGTAEESAEKLNFCHSEARCAPRNLSFPGFQSKRDSSLRSE